MRGGVVSNISTEEIRDQVYKILGNPLTKIEFMSRGTYGQLLKVTYPGTDSGFVDAKGVHVKVFILKVQGFDMRIRHTSVHEVSRSRADYEDFQDLYPYSETTTWDELNNEVILQQKIYECALDKQLMPPCPAILFYESITAEEFEMFAREQLVYKVDEDELHHVKPIHPNHYNHYHMGIILMEYIHSVDLASPAARARYAAKDQEIESKALRAYCTALQCGVLQSDPKPQNFLLTEDDNVVLIDFGIARELDTEERDEFEGLLEKAEHGDCEELRLKLTDIEKKDKNPCIDKLIFRPTLLKKGNVRYPTLAPAIRLSKEIAEQYKVGLYEPSPTLHDRTKMAHIQRQYMEAQERIDREAAEQEELKSYYQTKRSRFWGGKRHTKYVGSRRKTRTRRKV